MNLRGVPDDEAEDVRALLDEHDVAYYETPPNRWGINAGAIWLRDDERAEEVTRLLADYQRQRHQRARDEHDRRRREGSLDTVVARLRARPLASVTYVLIAAGLIYFTIRPFFVFGG